MIERLYEKIETLSNRLNKNTISAVFELSARLETLENTISDMQDEFRISNERMIRFAKRVDNLETTSANFKTLKKNYKEWKKQIEKRWPRYNEEESE